MREKLAIARQLRRSRKRFRNPEYRRLCLKCYYTYVKECIIKGKDNFQISFGSKYIQKFSIRFVDWCEYVLDSIYRFFLIHFNPDDDKTLRKYELIHFGVPKPIHPKCADMPNESFLERFLEKNGFKIVDEYLYLNSTVYVVIRK